MRLIKGNRMAVALAPLAAFALAASGCGGSDDTTTTTVTSTVTAPSGPAGTTTYTGTTEQGLPIEFTATPNAVLDLSFGWRAPCADGKERTNSIGLGGGPIHGGTFSFGGVLETGGVAQVEGTISGDRASGTFSRSRGTAFGIDCKITDVAWRAQGDSVAGQSS